jgi:hypothetical protein
MLVHSNPRSATACEQKESRSPFCGQGVIPTALAAFSRASCSFFRGASQVRTDV